MKENRILISILVPTYNRVKYLKECLDSIVGQKGFDLKELELIVSDNSEGDETKNLMEKYIKENENRNISYNKNKKNLGMVGNWNRLLELKKGKYFIFLSDDDKFYDKNSLINIYNGLLDYELDVCYGKYMSINGNGEHIGLWGGHHKIGKKDIYFDKFSEQIIFHSISFGGILYRDFGFKYEEKMNMAADWNMNLRYLYKNKRIGLINKYTFCYRDHENNTIKTENLKQILMWRIHNNKEFHVRFGIIHAVFYLGIVRLYPIISSSIVGKAMIKTYNNIAKYRNDR